MFSSLEHTINLVISDLINDRSHQPGYQVVSILKMNPKISLLQTLLTSLILQTGQEYKKEKLKAIINRLTNVNEFRNKIAHANWTSLKKDGTVRTSIKANNKLGAIEFIDYKISSTDIEERINEINDLIYIVDSFFMDAANESIGITKLK